MPGKRVGTGPGHLPARPSSFVGRQSLLASLRAAVSSRSGPYSAASSTWVRAALTRYASTSSALSSSSTHLGPVGGMSALGYVGTKVGEGLANAPPLPPSDNEPSPATQEIA